MSARLTFFLGPHRLVWPRTQGSHPCNRGSNPLGVTKIYDLCRHEVAETVASMAFLRHGFQFLGNFVISAPHSGWPSGRRRAFRRGSAAPKDHVSVQFASPRLRKRLHGGRPADEGEQQEVNGIGNLANDLAVTVGVAGCEARRLGAAGEVKEKQEESVGELASHNPVAVAVATEEVRSRRVALVRDSISVAIVACTSLFEQANSFASKARERGDRRSLSERNAAGVQKLSGSPG